MNLTTKDYEEMNKKASPNTKSYMTIPCAFIIGGIICTIGQALVNLYMYCGMQQEQASTVASVSLVFLSALLTGLKIYDNIAKVGGAGTLVPITGFANAVVAPALEFKSEGLILGLGAKMFIIAGPVIVYGVTASAIYGVILCLFNLV
ncbi:MAG: Stage sporulation protein [Oscillospiraceae bacterium]|nr:Stage sporulation protein [Oscillospiraceae bacterium]